MKPTIARIQARLRGMGDNYSLVNGMRGRVEPAYEVSNNPELFRFAPENYWTYEPDYPSGKDESLWSRTRDREDGSGIENQVFLDKNVHLYDTSASLYFYRENATWKGRAYPHTGAYIKSKARIHYGEISAVLRLPRSTQLWPSMWLITAPNKGGHEIDIMERFSGDDQNTYQTNLHGQYRGHRMMPKRHPLNDFQALADARFGIRWTPWELHYTLDGKIVHSIYRYYYLCGQPVRNHCRSHAVMENLLFPKEPMWLVFGVGIKRSAGIFEGRDYLYVSDLIIR